LVHKYITFSGEQNLYINYLLKENKVKEGSSYLLQSIDWISLVQNYDECPKDIIKDYIDQEITLTEYTKWLSTQPKIDLGLGVSSAEASLDPKAGSEEKKSEQKEEIKVDLINF
jgi:hypothetical protein